MKNKLLLRALNLKVRAIKTARNTFSVSRKFFNTKSKTQMSTELFGKGLLQRLKDSATAYNAVLNVKASQAGELKKLIKARKAIAKATQSELLKKAATIDRKVNARSKGITFRRIGGRIVPIRKK